MPILYSPDGRWYWNRQVWMPVPPARRTVFWFMSAPDWGTQVALMGLVLLIPIAGQIDAYGWALAAKDELRRDRSVVPPAGFAYMQRGVRPFLAGLVVGLVFFAVQLATIAVAIVATVQASQGSAPAALAVAGWVFAALVWLAAVLLGLLLWAPITVIADERGLRAAINPARLVRTMAANSSATWRAAGMYGLGTLAGIAVSLFIPFGAAFALAGVYAGTASAMAEMDVSRGDG